MYCAKLKTTRWRVTPPDSAKAKFCIDPDVPVTLTRTVAVAGAETAKLDAWPSLPPSTVKALNAASVPATPTAQRLPVGA